MDNEHYNNRYYSVHCELSDVKVKHGEACLQLITNTYAIERYGIVLDAYNDYILSSPAFNGIKSSLSELSAVRTKTLADKGFSRPDYDVLVNIITHLVEKYFAYVEERDALLKKEYSLLDNGFYDKEFLTKLEGMSTEEWLSDSDLFI